MKKNVLVLGADERSTLTVIRALGRKGICVHLGCDKKESVCRFSRYTEKTIDFPEAGMHPDDWLKTLENTLEGSSYDLVIPTSDDYLVLIVKNRHLFENHANLAVPDEKGFTFTYDKNKTFELAKRLSIPCPATFLINTSDDLVYIKTKISFPVVIKPTSSKVWKDQKRHSLTVRYAQDEMELDWQVSQILELCPVLLQSFHKGIGVGVELLLNKGNLVAAFQHERIHEPLGGGGSSYRKSTDLDSQLLGYSLKIMKALEWTGVAMVEYKYDKVTQQKVLMEINGRFWGSLPLAVRAGVNFPILLYDMLVNNRTPRTSTYKKNIYCRNIVNDIEWFRNNLTADKKNPLTITIPLKSIIMEYRQIIRGKEYYDTLAPDDILPGAVHIARFFKEKHMGLKNKITKKAHAFFLTRNSISTHYQKRKLNKLLNSSDLSILFVCKGNICRSTFAEYYCIQKSASQNLHSIKIKSTGFIQRENRSSPQLAVQAAKSFNIDLENHRSKVISQKDIDNFRIVFVMDIDLYITMVQIYPSCRNKLFLLGALGRPKTADDFEIHDPYGKDLDKFTSVFKQITISIDNLLDKIFQKQ